MDIEVIENFPTNVFLLLFRLQRNEQINQGSVRQTEGFPEVEDEAGLVDFTVLDIFQDIDLEYEVGECIGGCNLGILGNSKKDPFPLWVEYGSFLEQPT